MVMSGPSHYYRIKNDYNNAPQKINIAEAQKIIGQSLNGKNATLKPVNKDTTASASNVQMATAYTVWAAIVPGWTAVTEATNVATEMSATPSTIHSMVMICRLSSDKRPNPATTPLVAKRCATPQMPVNNDAV